MYITVNTITVVYVKCMKKKQVSATHFYFCSSIRYVSNYVTKNSNKKFYNIKKKKKKEGERGKKGERDRDGEREMERETS